MEAEASEGQAERIIKENMKNYLGVIHYNVCLALVITKLYFRIRLSADYYAYYLGKATK